MSPSSRHTPISLVVKTFEAIVSCILRVAVAMALAMIPAVQASAQVFEAVGSRALGMGGAFVALADDSSATWWNPAGLAAGPFLDLALGWSSADIKDERPARRERATWFAVGTPPFGFSYYRLRIIDIGVLDPTEQDSAGREDRRAAVPVWSLSASQVGATLVQTLISGVHAGTTLKYVRAAGLGGEVTGPEAASASELLDRASELGGGETRGTFDLDVGILGVRGPVRVGGVVRNLREAEFGGVRLPRQVRVGAAFDAAEANGAPFRVAVDADVRTYETSYGDRRVVAIGGEGWPAGHRVAIRAGARFNMVGAEERAVTAGASLAIRAGMYVDGYLVHGGARDESGWGIAARASF